MSKDDHIKTSTKPKGDFTSQVSQSEVMRQIEDANLARETSSGSKPSEPKGPNRG